MCEYWMVLKYDERAEKFDGYYKAEPFKIGLEPAVAKSIAKALNKRTPRFIHYWAEEEPRRLV